MVFSNTKQNLAAVLLLVTAVASAETSILSIDEAKTLTLKQQLGKQIFFDTNLSSPPGQSCAGCHDSKTAFTEPDQDLPVSKGAVAGRTGTRNAPSAKYASFSPQFHFDEQEGLYVGGQFLDGRAANLTEQAKGPFLNEDEMNNTSEAEVVDKLRRSSYSDLFKAVFGQQALDSTETAYHLMADAIAAFENSPIFNRFSSKYDYYLAGLVELSEQEQQGLELFEDEQKANCAACHISQPEGQTAPLFTDFTYDNIGVPSNVQIIALKGDDFVDIGLGKTVQDSVENGKFKVPSLRNIALTAPYMHNGVFTTLREVVDFYNTRDIDPKWPAPEVIENVNSDELGNLGLNDEEVDAIVAFMRTLTDGYQLTARPLFNVETLELTLPYVKLEGPELKAKIYTAQLQGVNGIQQFKLTNLTELPEQMDINAKQIPYFSVANGLLEIPYVQVNPTAEQQPIEEYVAQLKLVKGAAEVTFDLLYLKVYQ